MSDSKATKIINFLNLKATFQIEISSHTVSRTTHFYTFKKWNMFQAEVKHNRFNNVRLNTNHH